VHRSGQAFRKFVLEVENIKSQFEKWQ
jgi:hypothetical protein